MKRLSDYANNKQTMLDEENERVEEILTRLKNNQATARDVFLNWDRLKVKLQFEDRELYNEAYVMYQDYKDLII